MFFLLYIVCYPVVLLIVMAFRDNHGSIGDYLVGPYSSAFLWTFVPAILLSIIMDVYKKGKKEQAEIQVGDDEPSFSLKQDEVSQTEVEMGKKIFQSTEVSKDQN